MIPVAAPPRVRDRLRAAPDGPVPVLHSGPRALYVAVGGWCVGVVTAGAARVPCALRAAVTDFGVVLPEGGRTAYLGDGTLHLDGRPLPIGRLEPTHVPRIGAGGVPGKQADPVTVQATPPATVAGFVADRLRDGRIDAQVARDLIGRGPGLTPLGDDVLAGWLAMHRAAGVPTGDVDDVVREHAARTTLLSATLLDCAQHGEVLPEYAAWLRALGTAEEPARVRALHRVGATSGAGLHLGGRLALAGLGAAVAA